MRKSVENPVAGIVEIAGENGGEIGVLKDAIGLGVLLLIIASTQMAGFMFGA